MALKRAYVLLSGGIDSTVCLFQAMQDCSHVEAIAFDYGQRHKKEIEAAARICGERGIPFGNMMLPPITPLASPLTNPGDPIPNVSYDDLIGRSPTFVPGRNLRMLATMNAYVQGEQMMNSRSVHSTIYFGANAADAANDAYPDCTPEFIGCLGGAIAMASNGTIRLHAPLSAMKKWQVIELGALLHIPFEDTWSCYAGGELHCGTCPTCRARREGFTEAGVADPTVYASDAVAA